MIYSNREDMMASRNCPAGELGGLHTGPVGPRQVKQMHHFNNLQRRLEPLARGEEKYGWEKLWNRWLYHPKLSLCYLLSI